MTLEEILRRRAELKEQVATRSADLTIDEMNAITKELDELDEAEKKVRAKMELDKRMAQGTIPVVPVSSENSQVKAAQLRAARGARYKVRDGKAVSLRSDVEGTGQNGVLIPSHLDPKVDAFPWNEVNSVMDIVRVIPLPNGNEYTKAFQTSTDEGDYTAEATTTGTASSDDGKYHEVGISFDKVTIKRNKVTALTYESEELELLPDADYATLVESNVSIALKKKLAREIIVGNGTGVHFVGIAATSNINANTHTDKAYDIDENTLLDMMVDYGGAEDVEGKQVLVMNKQTIKKFARVRGVNKQPVYNITVTGNTFTIDGYRGIFTSHLPAFDSATAGQIYMVYGDFSQYYLLDFGGDTIETSKEFKFDQGITAVRGKVYSGGAPAGYKAFLRATKPAANQPSNQS